MGREEGKSTLLKAGTTARQVWVQIPALLTLTWASAVLSSARPQRSDAGKAVFKKADCY